MRPLIVLVHGSLSSAHEWDAYRELLPGADVAAVDLPGHGTRAGEPFSTDAAVSVIAGAAARRRPGQPVIVVGHSLGGYMASVFAARHPEALDGLVMIGASADPGSRAAGVYRGFAWITERVSHAWLARVRDRIACLIGLADEQLPPASAYAALPASWRAVMEDCPPELLAHVTCPVLILNGQFDQMRLNEWRYLALVRDGALILVPGATHLAPMTHARKVASRIWSFSEGLLRRLGAHT